MDRDDLVERPPEAAGEAAAVGCGADAPEIGPQQAPVATAAPAMAELMGDVAVIGAFSGSVGSAYVFRYDADSAEWVEEQKITASDGAAADGFGRSVAVSGDVAVVGALGDDDRGNESGSAYVLHLCED